MIGGEVAFVLGDGLNNFASGLPLDESFDRAFIFADFGQFEKNLMNKAKELGYDDNQLNLLQQTIDINKLFVYFLYYQYLLALKIMITLKNKFYS